MFKRPIGAPNLKQVVYLTLGDTTLELLDLVDPAPYDDTPRVGYRIMSVDRTEAVVGGRSQPRTP